MSTRDVPLTNEECLLLDGKVSEKAQAVVNIAKRQIDTAQRLSALTEAQAAFVSDVVTEAVQSGRLICRPESMRRCGVCGKSAGYAVHARNGRYHRKGDRNLDRPLALNGFQFRHDFIEMKGYPSLACCRECFTVLKPFLAAELESVRAVIPEAITGHPPRFTRLDNKRCTQCGWTGHEGEMRRRRTILGDGTYAAGCPKCSAENLLFGPALIENQSGFTLTESQPCSTPAS